MRTKIAFIIPTLSLGGAEKQQINILNGINTLQYRVKLYVLKDQTQLLNQIKNSDIEVEICKINSFKNFKNFYLFIKSIKRYNPDIIHSQMYNANILTRLIKCILPNSKIINHFHGMSQWMSKLKLLLDKSTLFLVDRFIVVSQKSYDLRLEREKYPAEKMDILYNSVNLHSKITMDPFSLDNKTITIGMASRLIPLKNIKAAIYMLFQLRQKNLDVELLIAGDGSEMEDLQFYAQELAVETKVTFLGFVENMKKFYDDIDIYCISSLTEDLPLSVIEAMMSGKPIISSNVGGIPDILKSVDYTLLVNDFYDKSEIEKIYNMLRYCHGKECATYLHNIAMTSFDNKSYCKKLENIYKDFE